jgi:hypothetical protein
MRYMNPRFTLPAGPARTSQTRWDFSLLTEKEFIAKYGEAVWKKLLRVST